VGLFDTIMGAVEDHPEVTNMASKLGIDPSLAQQAIAALGEAHHQDGDTVELAAAKTGLDQGTLAQVVEQIGGEGSLARFGQMLDLDGDGNPLNDVAGFAGKLFGKE
jgi:hypothetical protein